MNNDKCCGGQQQPDDKVEKKLAELEQSLPPLTARSPLQVAPVASKDLLQVDNKAPTLKDDFYYFSGIGLIVFGLLIFFQHIRVGTGLFQALGLTGGGFGLLMLPLLLGIGMIVYNSKNKLGYLIISVTCAIIFYGVLASLIMTFPSVSLLGLIFMLAPLAAGGAFVVRGLGGPKGVEYHLRKQGLLKSEK